MRGRRGRQARRRVPAPVGVSVATALASVLFAAPAAYADETVGTSGIQTEQRNVVAAEHQGPLALARLGVAQFDAAVTHDSQALAADRAAQAEAAARATQAAGRLTTDEQVLSRAITALAEAEARLQGDRAQLRAIAIGMYTGALTNPQPTSLRQLEAEQTQIIDAAEVGVVAGVVDGHVHADVATATSDARARTEDADQVAADRSSKARADEDATNAAARTGSDEKALASDQAALGQANHRLDAEEAALASALASVSGPTSTPAGQLSLLGGAALTSSELVGWYHSQGYVDMTTAPIDQLAAWYIQAGVQEGVRGDVAFAQAVLETGGFSSPDAVYLSNFAGIGHCDTCAAGWAFPTPQAGVLGHVQLLRIFADQGAGPADAPPPVLPVLVPAKQMSAGRCPTVESLTGVWATDPTYGQQILLIYGEMLGYALSNGPPS